MNIVNIVNCEMRNENEKVACTPLRVELQSSDRVKAHRGVTNTKQGSYKYKTGESQIQIRIAKEILKL